MRITLGVVALVALAAVAVASPFAGIEAADEGLGFEIGVSNYGITVYLLKWVPQTLAGWWAFGGEAAVRIAGLPNISFGAGVLLSIEWDDWEMSDSAWGPYFLVLGSMGSFDVFGEVWAITMQRRWVRLSTEVTRNPRRPFARRTLMSYI